MIVISLEEEDHVNIRTIAPHQLARARSRSALLLLGALLMPLLVACAQQSSGATAAPAAAAKTIKVVTTMSILADMVKNVGGERVVAENIIPIGAGPEDYQPTPQDAQKLAGAIPVPGSRYSSTKACRMSSTEREAEMSMA